MAKENIHYMTKSDTIKFRDAINTLIELRLKYDFKTVQILKKKKP